MWRAGPSSAGHIDRRDRHPRRRRAVRAVSGVLDETDRRLLELLAEDARLPLTGLARRLGIARSTVQVRLARLEARGVIAGYTVRLGPAHHDDDRGVEALVSLVVDARQVDRVVGELEACREVRSLHAVSGAVDLVALVRCPTPVDLDRLLDRIGATPGVERTNSSVVLATRIDRRDPT
jgi:DNA-binding Lrp family transcriptional regulator